MKGNRDSYAVYSETSIPVLGSNFSAPGFRVLDFTAAARFEGFSNGDNVVVPKFGMRWQPIDDSPHASGHLGRRFSPANPD